MNQSGNTGGSSGLGLILAWIWVGIPLLWGVWVTIGNVAKLFAPAAAP
jgi:hypothetical protein